MASEVSLDAIRQALMIASEDEPVKHETRIEDKAVAHVKEGVAGAVKGAVKEGVAGAVNEGVKGAGVESAKGRGTNGIPNKGNTAYDIARRSAVSDVTDSSTSQSGSSKLRRKSSKQRPIGGCRNMTSWAFLEMIHAEPVNKQVSESVSVRMSRICQKAMQLLDTLQQPSCSKFDASGDPVLPISALKFSRALAFEWKYKAGFFASCSWGYGFIIYQIADGVWSAPCFLKDRYVAFGVTCGYTESQKLDAIATEEGLVPFMQDMFKSTCDLAMSLGPDPLEQQEVKVRSGKASRGMSRDQAALTTKVYKVENGAIIDVSWKCGLEMVDEGFNSSLYGEKNNFRDILDGKVQIPKEFHPLYDLLQLYSMPVICRETKSHFHVEREKHVNKAMETLQKMSEKPGKAKRLARATSLSSQSSIGTPSQTTYTPDNIGSPDDSLALGSNQPLFGDGSLLDLDLGSDSDEKEEQQRDAKDGCTQLV